MPPFSDAVCLNTARKMINAVLVFNQNGEPRLTKFYSPVVSHCHSHHHSHHHSPKPTSASTFTEFEPKLNLSILAL